MTAIIKHKATVAAMSVAAALSLSMLCACEGRKMSNMKPKGETVEVNITTPADMPAHEVVDTLANSDSIL